MKNFVIYDPPTGTILRCGFCTDDDFDLQANEGEGIVEHERVDDTMFRVIDGQVVAID